MRTSLLVCVCASLAYAAPQDYRSHVQAGQKPLGRSPVKPKLKREPRLLGVAGDSNLDRDSCGTAKFGDRVLWTCRDSQLYKEDGSVQIDPLISSTAGWSDVNAWGPLLSEPAPDDETGLSTTVLKQYGRNTADKAYFPVQPGQGDEITGSTGDGTRYTIWPDSPPMVTKTTKENEITAYTWILQWQSGPDLKPITANPATTLYRLDYQQLTRADGLILDPDSLPSVSVVNHNFWAEDEFAFGAYGNVIRNGIAYLYANSNGTIALAKVPAHLVEDRSAYSYWVHGRWTPRRPRIGDSGVHIPLASTGGQGTYYYSEHWQCFVWIGGSAFPTAEVFITTAPSPTGPWEFPEVIYDGPVGSYDLGAYSVQAHPALVGGDPRNSSMFVTYTKNDVETEDTVLYTHPLIYFEFE